MKIFITEAEIQNTVARLADQINAHYDQKTHDLVLVGLLKGSVIFMADLCRKINRIHELDFIWASSYQNQTTFSGAVQIIQPLRTDIAGKDVLIVEDIIDTGHTLSYIVENLKQQNPNSIKICTLLNKPSRRVIHLDVDFVGFKIMDYFVVGYGLDYEQRYRHLPYIGILDS